MMNKAAKDNNINLAQNKINPIESQKQMLKRTLWDTQARKSNL